MEREEYLKEVGMNVGERYLKLRYDLNGHGDEDDLEDVSLIAINENICAAEKLKEKGYKFVEWNTDKDGDGEGYKPGEDIDIVASLRATREHDEYTNTITLYAIWKKRNPLIWFIILLALLLLGALGGLWYMMSHQPQTAVVAPIEENLSQDTSTGQIRIRISSSVTVIDGSMQNLNFQNINTDRLMKCKIKVEGGSKYIYESQYVEYGQMITADVIDTSNMKRGDNSAIAELYTYDNKTKEQLGQVNVKLILNNN